LSQNPPRVGRKAECTLSVEKLSSQVATNLWVAGTLSFPVSRTASEELDIDRWDVQYIARIAPEAT
jgi:hypothetical protein